MNKLLSVSEVAEWLGVSSAWVRDHASGRREPKLPAIKLGTQDGQRALEVHSARHRRLHPRTKERVKSSTAFFQSSAGAPVFFGMCGACWTRSGDRGYFEGGLVTSGVALVMICVAVDAFRAP